MKLFYVISSTIFLNFNLLAATFFVTPNGAGLMNGTSWANAAPGNNLQSIITASVSGDRVWVACGTYLPTTGTNRSISFNMKTGVEIYGGFQGTETMLSQRVFSCGPCSILSGEIGSVGINDNSYTVVYNQSIDSTAVLDGFFIRDGNDDRSPTSSGLGLGGGVYNHGFGSGGFCHPTIRNCIFVNNRASWGGGAFNNGYNGGNTRPTYINCIFYQNHGYIEAGGMDSYGVGGTASPKVFNTIFYENTSATNVGAMYAWGGNSGGNCHPVLTNCAFVNNHAQNGYGGAFIADNLDENNTTSSGSCTVTLKNCIVWNNTATGVGPQFYVRGNGAQVIANYSDIDTLGQFAPNIISGPQVGNISTNPLFLNISNALGADSCWLTSDDGLRPNLNSPCVDAGNSSGTHSSDITGSPRTLGPNTDMGPYENQLPTLLFEQPNNSIKLFPNPTKDKVFINSSESIKNIVLQTIAGSFVSEESFIFSGNVLDISFLPNGVYLLRINDNYHKIVKQ